MTLAKPTGNPSDAPPFDESEQSSPATEVTHLRIRLDEQLLPSVVDDTWEAAMTGVMEMEMESVVRTSLGGLPQCMAIIPMILTLPIGVREKVVEHFSIWVQALGTAIGKYYREPTDISCKLFNIFKVIQRPEMNEMVHAIKMTCAFTATVNPHSPAADDLIKASETFANHLSTIDFNSVDMAA